MTANVSLKQAVIGVEGFLIGTVDTQVLRKDVEKRAEFLLGLIAIFNVDHVCCVAGNTVEAWRPSRKPSSKRAQGLRFRTSHTTNRARDQPDY